LLTLALAFALTFTGPQAGPAASAAPTAAAAMPARGVLAPGKSLGGIKLGDTVATVKKRWGTAYTVCRVCKAQTWMYTYRTGRLSGAAVSFRKARVIAIFTLGAPNGWRTQQGLELGDLTQHALALYRTLGWSRCIGYGALTMRRPGVVTSIYTFGESVYGFALTRPSEPVCQ
jgi:hypothetical protein